MSGDSKYFSDDENRQIILAAVNSLAGAQFENKEDMEKRVLIRALSIQKFLKEDSAAMRVLGSIIIYAHIDKVEYEESSKRYIVYYTQKREGAEQEQLRTPRMDRFEGRLIKEAVENAPGHMALVYKKNEPVPEGVKGDKVPTTQGYRVMPWIEVFPNR